MSLMREGVLLPLLQFLPCLRPPLPEVHVIFQMLIPVVIEQRSTSWMPKPLHQHYIYGIVIPD